MWWCASLSRNSCREVRKQRQTGQRFTEQLRGAGSATAKTRPCLSQLEGGNQLPESTDFHKHAMAYTHTHSHRLARVRTHAQKLKGCQHGLVGKVFPAKPGDPSLISRTYVLEGEGQLLKLSSLSCMDSHTQANRNKNSERECTFKSTIKAYLKKTIF